MRLFVCAIALAIAVPAGSLPRDPLTDQLVWLPLCEYEYGRMERKMRQSGTPMALTPWQSKRLSMMFGPELRGIEFRFGSRMAEIKIAGKRIGPEADGQTFGNRVHIKYYQQDKHWGQLKLLAHEIVHVGQWRHEGGTKAYCRGIWKANFKYRDIPQEKAAFEAAERFIATQRQISDEQLAFMPDGLVAR